MTMDARTMSPDEQAIEVAALRPMASGGRRFWFVAGLLGAVVLAAFLAYVYMLVNGLWVAGYNDQAFWGIYEANLVTFIGVSYGGALVSAVLRLLHAPWRTPIARMAEATALVTLLVGGSFAIIHLGNPGQLWRLLLTPQLSSPIVWDFYAVLTYLAATLIFLYLPLIPDLALVRDRVAERGGWRRRVYRLLALGWQGRPDQRRRLEAGITIMSILIIPLAICVHSVLAWAFSMTSRPGWDSTIFAPYFVVAALYSGVALVMLVIAGFRRAYHLQAFLEAHHFVNLARIMVVLGAVYLYFTFADLLTAGYVRTEGQQVYVAALLEGGFAAVFWLWFTAGLLTPIVLGGLLSFLPERRRIPVAVAAAALVVVGMALKRLLIVLPSAQVPLIGSTWGAGPVTWVPALITLGAVAAVPLLLMLLFRVIPIMAVDEMAHGAIAPAPTATAIGREALEV